MASTMLGSLLLALLVQDGAAAVMTPPAATITTAPLLKRAVTTIGCISTRESVDRMPKMTKDVSVLQDTVDVVDV